jgi:hypothetical protein
MAQRIVEHEKIRHAMAQDAMLLYLRMRAEHGSSISGAEVRLLMTDGSRARVSITERSFGDIQVHAGVHRPDHDLPVKEEGNADG